MVRAFAASAFAAAVLGLAIPTLAAPSDESANSTKLGINFTFSRMPEPGEVRRYKGHILVGSKKPRANNAKFFSHAAKVIDLAEQLPAGMRKGSDLIRVFYYDPPNGNVQNTNSREVITGEYRMPPDFYKMGAFVVTRDVTWVPPIQVGYAFVEASLLAKLHHNTITLSDRLKNYPVGSEQHKSTIKKYKLINGLLMKTNASAMEKFKCEHLRAKYTAMHSWKDDKLKINSQRRRLVKAQCTVALKK